MKAIIIARVSTEEQREAGNSLPAQIARLENYCIHKKFEVIKSFSFDESAYTDNRVEFDSIINFIDQQTECVAVCFDKVDRLSRNIFDKRVRYLYQRALSNQLELHFASEGRVINAATSASDTFGFNMTLGLAKYFSDAIRENVKRGIEQKVRKGEFSAKAPFGYKNVRIGDKNDIVVDDHAAHIVKTAFELYATGAYSIDTIADAVRDRFGLKWSKGYIDWLLKHPFYYGEMRWDGKLHPHRYPALISRELFDRVQSIKAGFNKKKRKYGGIPYMYRGLIRCATCDCSMTPSKHKGHVYYYCTQAKFAHPAPGIREEKITEQLGEIFGRMHLPEDALTAILRALTEAHQHKKEFYETHLKRLQDEQLILGRQRDMMYADRLSGRISEEMYDHHAAQLDKRRHDVAMSLQGLEEDNEEYYVTAKLLLEVAHEAYDLFISSNVEERRILISLVLWNLKFDGKNVLCDVQKPFDKIIESNDRQEWCTLLDVFMNRQLDFTTIRLCLQTLVNLVRSKNVASQGVFNM